MASTSYTTKQQEGLSSFRPPFFDGEYYDTWKTSMRLHLESLDMDLWYVIEDGPYVPMKTRTVDNIVQSVVASRYEWSDDDKKKMSLNSKAMSILLNALHKNEARYVSSCKNAQEIWLKLEMKHEGTNQVKESKINMLMHSYELFKMTQNESISDMDQRLTEIVNSLESLGKSFSNQEKVQKILRSLPPSWDPKVTAIQEAKDLTVFKKEELIGSLLVYETNMNSRLLEKEEHRILAFKGNDLSEDESSDGEDSPDDPNENMRLMAKMFKKIIKLQSKMRPSKEENTSPKSSAITATSMDISLLNVPTRKKRNQSTTRKLFKLHGMTLILKITLKLMRYML